MPSASDLLLLKFAHAQLHAEFLHGIAADLQHASIILNTRAADLDAYFHSLRAMYDEVISDTSQSSPSPSQEEVLEVANAMASTDAMVEIREQLKRHIQALIDMKCRPGVSEQTDAKVYVDWKNSSRDHDFNFEESMSDKISEISTLTGIKIAVPASPVHPKTQIDIPTTTSSPAALGSTDSGLASPPSTPAPSSARHHHGLLMSSPPSPVKQSPKRSLKRKQRMDNIKKSAASPDKMMSSPRRSRPVWGVFKGCIKTEDED